jgi:hypothetical protein
MFMRLRLNPFKNRRLGAILGIAAITLASSVCASAQTLVDTLLAGYDRIQSVTCDVVKDAESDGRTLKTLSHVYYQKPDRLHVENIAPIQRRIVADGTHFYSFITGDPKGFARPISRLEADMLVSLRKVPASPMEHLLRLKGLAETNLPSLPDFPVRRGYAAAKTFVTLALDASNRLARIEFHPDAACTTVSARCDYSGYKEALPGVWLMTVHTSTFNLAGLESHETSRYHNLIVNGAIAPNLFNPRLFFKDVSFVADFDELYRGL